MTTPVKPPAAPTAPTVSHPPHQSAPARAATKAAPPPPSLMSVQPPSAYLGDPDFNLHVYGSGFTPTSVIVFAGNEEPTTLVAFNHVVTGVDMSVWKGVDPAVPVLVRDVGGDSNTLTFAFQPALPVPVDPADPSKPIPEMDLI